VLNKLHKWGSNLIADKRRGKKFNSINMDVSHTFEHIENSLEHWITSTYNIDSGVVKVETSVCIVH